MGAKSAAGGKSATGTKVAPPPPPPQEDKEQESWVSPWGSLACATAALALVVGTTLALRWVTAGIAALGVLLVAGSYWATREERRSRDGVWAVVGGGLNGLILLLAVVAPGVLNSWWVMDTQVPPPDLQTQVVAPRDRPLEDIRPVTPDDWADASTESIRQGDIQVRVESVRFGSVAGLPDSSYLRVHLRVANCRHENTVTLEGFGGDRQPALTDESGHSYPFRGARVRKLSRGTTPVFEESGQPVVIGPGAPGLFPADSQDYLLVFAAPPARFDALKLEIPASAWGRNGSCRFRFSRLFDASGPKVK